MAALVQIMALRRTGDKPSSESVLLCFTDAYMHNSVSMSYGIIYKNKCAYLYVRVLSFGSSVARWMQFIVARLSKRLATLTLGSSKINQHCWRFHGSGVIAAPQIIGWISFCTGMHHEYFFEVANVLSCSPFMFENTENKQLDWRIRHSHLASTLFHSLVPWWRPRRIRPQITRLSQLENSAMGTWPIYKNSIIPDWFEKWRDIKFWYRC